MTTLRMIATTCLAASGLAMAQGEAGMPGQAAGTSGPMAPRTGLYTGVTRGNAAADNTVDDFSRRPTLIGDQQYVAGFGGADMGEAAFSFRGMGFNWFGEVTTPVSTAAASTPDLLRLGLGAGTAWGGGLLLSVNRTYAKDAAGNKTTTYFDASGLGVFGDFNIGMGDVYGSVGWNTGFPSGLAPAPHNSVTVDPATGSTVENTHHQLGIMAGWKKDATTEGTHALNIELGYILGMHTNDAPDPDLDDKANVFTLLPSWGYILRAAPGYSVFIGANGEIFVENDDVAPVNGNQYGVSVSPNFAFQKQFGKGFEGFSGFSVTASYDGTSDEPADNQESSQYLTGGADVTVGLRWVKDNFALEGSLKEAVLANGPYLIGGNAGQGLFAQIGMALGI